MSDQIPGAGPPQKQITASEFAAKFKSKKEVYLLLTLDARAYLPHHTTITIYFLKDLISGTKKFVNSDNVKHMAVPQYESLSVKEIMKYITANPISKFYLPVAQELEKLPKQWLCNVIYSTDELNFAQWVKRRILERNQGIVKQKKLAINMDKDVMQAFLNSTAVSTSKGNAANMLKSGIKRRRTQQEIKHQQEEETIRQQSIEDKLQKMDELQERCNQLELKASLNNTAFDMVGQMIEGGVCKMEGNNVILAPYIEQAMAQENSSQQQNVMEDIDEGSSLTQQ